jgi:hypothetical protein
MIGRGRALERVLARIPRTVVGVHPELAGALALARVALGSDAQVAAMIGLGRAAVGTVSAARAARAGVLLDLSASGLARIAGDWEAAVAVYRRMPVEPASLAALGMAGAEVVPVVAANNRGTAALWAGDWAEADRHLTAAMDANLDTLAIPQLNAIAYHFLLRCERGELGPAEAAARRVIATASAAGLEMAVQVVGAYLTMVHVKVDRGEADEADEWLERIADVEAITPEPHVRLAAAIVLAMRREAAGDRETALAGLRTQGDLAGWRPPSGLRERWMLTEAALLARADNGTDRAVIAALSRLLPACRRCGLPVTPSTILRWHHTSSATAGPSRTPAPADPPSPPASAL